MATSPTKKPAKKTTSPIEASAIPAALQDRIATIAALAAKAGVTLAKPARAEAIAAVEAKLGVSLPVEVRAFYLAHDGGPANKPTFADRWLLSLDGMARYWALWQESDEEELDEDVDADRGVRKEWWNEKWLPVSHDAGGNHEMLDLAPAKGGKVGQIVSVYHDDGGRTLDGPDFLGWLEAKLTEAVKSKDAKGKAPKAGATKVTATKVTATKVTATKVTATKAPATKPVATKGGPAKR